MREALAHPHLEQRGSFRVIDDGAGQLKVPNPAFRFSHAPASARGYVPAFGADNAGALSSVLGYSEDRIAALYQDRILHDAGSRA